MIRRSKFEYGVILKGSQTKNARIDDGRGFEYGVILKGSQTTLTLSC